MRIRLLFLIFGAVALLAGCGSDAEALPPTPTRTPLPTFTPTSEVIATPVDPAALATAQAAAVETAQAADAGAETGGQTQTDSGQGQAPPTATPVPPSPTPARALVRITSPMNLRGGPSTNYTVIATVGSGESYPVTGKNPAGDWWQIDYNGQIAWIYGPLVTAENTGGVQVAANIPPEPVLPTATPAPPTPTPAPAQPTQPPAPTYRFNIAVVGACDRQPAGTWFEGKTYVGGQPQNGYRVVFSYAPDGPWVTEPQLSGPHEGYPNWDTGFYSHIISASRPIAGTWYVWLVDEGGNRISEMASWSSTGPGEGCNQAVVDFDSR